jgi:hypothetical protein
MPRSPLRTVPDAPPAYVKGLPVQDFSRDPWIEEPIQVRPTTGRIRYLILVQRDRCCYCDTGTRTISIWATSQGRAEAVAWCGHCFNATCEPVTLDEEHRRRYEAVRAAVAQGKVSPPWAAARPALEDLERRGLL